MNLSRPQKLKFVFAATVLAAAAIEGTVLAQQHHAPAGRDAFLTYQVDSTDELVATLQKNKTLRQRYARHFGIPENRVIAFVKEALVPYRIPRDTVVTDHGVTKSGRIYPVKVKLKKGTKVWATRSGLPVLKWACANPVAKTLPGTLLAGVPRSTKAPLSAAPPLQVASNLAPILAPLPEGNVSSPEIAVPDTVAVDTSALAAPPALSGSGSSSVPFIGSATLPRGGGGNGPGVGAFVIPAVIAVAITNGGGPTDNTIITPTPPGVDVLPPVPGGNNSGDNTGNPGGNNGGVNSNPGGDNGGNPGGNNGMVNGGNNGMVNGGNPGGDNSANNGNGNNGGSPTVPEPGTFALFASAGIPALFAARKRLAKK